MPAKHVTKIMLPIIALIGSSISVIAQEIDGATLTDDLVFALQNQEDRCYIPEALVGRWQSVAALQVQRGTYSDGAAVEAAAAREFTDMWWAGLLTDGLLESADGGGFTLTTCPELTAEEEAARQIQNAQGRIAAMSSSAALSLFGEIMAAQNCEVPLAEDHEMTRWSIAYAAASFGVEMPNPMPEDDAAYLPLIDDITSVLEFAADQLFEMGALTVQDGYARLSPCTPLSDEETTSAE